MDDHNHKFVWGGGGYPTLDPTKGPTVGYYSCECGERIGVIVDRPISGPDATAYGYVIEGQLLREAVKEGN